MVETEVARWVKPREQIGAPGDTLGHIATTVSHASKERLCSRCVWSAPSKPGLIFGDVCLMIAATFHISRTGKSPK
ncbi:MAG: hypothetical protein R8G34_20125 [Paracoccaceae bacterium]|nr:hypothetical protein [Paracoccaceae bacterium]